MHDLHEVVSVTSNGQVTLPQPVRHFLGIDTGGKLAFDIRANEVVISRMDGPHEDPTIGAFLNLLDADIRNWKNVASLPED